MNIAGVQVTPIRPAFSDFIAAHPARFADSPTSLRGEVGKCVDDLQRWRDELGISYWHLGGKTGQGDRPVIVAQSVGRVGQSPAVRRHYRAAETNFSQEPRSPPSGDSGFPVALVLIGSRSEFRFGAWPLTCWSLPLVA